MILVTLNRNFSINFVKNCRNFSTMNDLTTIFLAGVASVQPKSLIKKTVQIKNKTLIVNGNEFVMKKPCYVVGFGKGVYGMALELQDILGENLQNGVVTVPSGIFTKFGGRPKCECRIQFIEGAKDNIPDLNAFEGSLKIKKMIEKLDKEDLVVVLITGGGSALLPYPKEPMTLEEKQIIIKSLSKGGADIKELNSVRKKLSELKGGGLAKLALPAKVISLILSDIVGDPLDFIASGPTVTNLDSPDKALNIIKKYELFEKLPEHVKVILKSENTFKVTNAENFIIGNNKLAVEACRTKAISFGYETRILTTKIQDDVEVLSKFYAELAALIYSSTSKTDLRNFLESAKSKLDDIDVEDFLQLDFSKNICIIGAGEPTVVVKGKGKGGRNQELALRFSVEVNKFSGAKMEDISFLSAGTDGMDGPTDAAGALGSSNLVNKAAQFHISPTQFLPNNDSYNFYSQFDNGTHLIKTGHTGTNVMDIHLIIIQKNK
nr:glycerate kinase [Onthophagus taurus]